MPTRNDGLDDTTIPGSNPANPWAQTPVPGTYSTDAESRAMLPDEYRDFTNFDSSENLTRDREEAVGLLNRLLRGEISAVKSYTEVIKDVDDAEVRTLLARNLEEHTLARDRLTSLVREMGGVPDESGGAWTALVDAMAKGANLFSTGLALDVLKMGERHGISEYEELLNEPGVRDRSAALLRTFLRGQFRHLERLDSAESAHKRQH